MTNTGFLPMTASPEFIAHHAKAESETHNFKIGDILVEEWGATMSLVQYYQVVGTKGKSTLILHAIEGDEQNTGFLTGRSTPKKDSFLPIGNRCQLLTRRVKKGHDGNWSVKIRDFGAWARLHIDGKSYAYDYCD